MAEVKHANENLIRKYTPRNAQPEEQANDGLTREHQTGAQAFAVSIVFKDKRRRESFPWSMYAGHEWTDDGEEESIVAFFGERGFAVRGYRLGALDRDLGLGKRASIKEHNKAQVEAMLGTEGEEPVIVSIETFPQIRDMLAALKGESDEDGHAGNTERR